MHPTGTVTFLFTDIEGSTHLWETNPGQMRLAFSRQEQIIREGIQARGGYPYKMIGDAFQAAFSTAPAALQAAVEIQRALNAQSWGNTPISVRMAIHVGVTEERGDDYVGPALNRVGRLLACGYGGQILLTQAAADLVAEALPIQIQLKDLGSHFLKDLVRPENIYQALHKDLPVDFPRLKTIDALPNNLPLQLTSFIGREKEITELHQLFAKEGTRLVTLIGPGGTGKTRLSVQIAAELLDQFSDGCWLVELAALMDPDLVPKMVAAVFDIREVPEKSLTTSLISFLRSKKLMLILDNCEHLVEACAGLADKLLRACPGLVILASSREMLGIGGEVAFRVPSLSIPDLRHLPALADIAQYDAVRLFVERAQTIRPDFILNEENTPWVAQIVSRLDGIPLAIELAAARVRLLSPAQISSRLDDAFRLLTGGSRAVLPRHQTLRALIDWSYDLLSAKERTLFRRLSVFSSSWSLEGAEAVCSFPPSGSSPDSMIEDFSVNEVFDLISQLVDKSLIFGLESGTTELRYRMMETIRQYAHEKLVERKESQLARNQHLRYYLRFAETAEPFLRAREQVHWMNQVENELDNLRQALEWALEKDIQAELRLSSVLMWFWHIRGQASEGTQWLKQGLEKTPATTSEEAGGIAKEVRAKALYAFGFLMSEHDTMQNALPYLEESFSIYQSLGEQSRSGAAYACGQLAKALQHTADHERAKKLTQQAVQWFQEQNDLFGLSESYQLLANPHDDPEQTRRLYLQVLALKREIGDTDGAAYALVALSRMAFSEGDYPQALLWLEESLKFFREVGNRRFTAVDLENQAMIYWALADYSRAIGSIDEAITISRENDHHLQFLMSSFRKGEILLRARDTAAAKTIFQEILQDAQELQDRPMQGFALVGAGEIEFQNENFDLAREIWLAALKIGEETYFWPLLRETQLWLVEVALWQEDLQQAETGVRESIIHQMKTKDLVGLTHLLEIVASLAIQQKDYPKAARLFGAADQNFNLLKNMLLPIEHQRREAEMAELRVRLGAELFEKNFCDGASLTLKQINEILNAG